MAIVTRPISIDWGITGLEGTDVLGYRVFSADGIELIPRTTAGVTEYAPGQYVATVTTWDTSWQGLIVWEDDTGTPEGTASDAFLPMDLPAAATTTLATINTATAAINGKLPADTTTKLNRLDATVGSRATPADVTSAVPTAIANADALLDRVDAIETGWTVRKTIRQAARALFGKTSNGQKTFRDLNDTKNAIVATLDSDGDRTTIVHDAT